MLTDYFFDHWKPIIFLFRILDLNQTPDVIYFSHN